jgi:hypothetical protein
VTWRLPYQAPVPGQQRARGHDPVQPQAPGQQPCQRSEHGAVSPVRPRTGNLTPQHRDLLPQHKYLRVLGGITPALPSLIQRALEPTAQRRNTPVRLLLCGSALSFMGKLLAGSAPLRGRAGLELLVPTLDYRLAREFWGIGDLRTAMLTNAIVGGTPAYRREFA